MRRGRDTANEVFGNQASVLVGRLRVFARLPDDGGAQLAARDGNHGGRHERHRRRRSAAAHECARSGDHRAALSRSDLSQDGAAVRGRRGSGRRARRTRSPEVQRALAKYGRHLGTAYQLVDDVLDYRSDPAMRGKNIGDDLAEGKPTLPLIHALKHGTEAQQAAIRHAIEKGGIEQLDDDRRGDRCDGRSRVHRAARARGNRQGARRAQRAARDTVQRRAWPRSRGSRSSTRPDEWGRAAGGAGVMDD